MSLREPIIEVPPSSDFSIYNLPYGVFRARSESKAQVGVALGDYVLKLSACAAQGLFDDCDASRFSTETAQRVFRQPSLNAFMALGPRAWTEARRAIQTTLSKNGSSPSPSSSSFALLRNAVAAGAASEYFVSASDVVILLPAQIGDYTDFYASREHATNLGRMMRGAGNELMPNWLHLPVGYHGRASSIVPSGADVRRPCGQTKADDADAPAYGPCRLLDFELEMGFLVARDTRLGEPVAIEDAREHIFGLVLVNDWSARDVQKWEYQPLGPFNAKNFATTLSPWVVPLEALEPFRVPAPPQHPPVLPYLEEGARRSTFDLPLSVELNGTCIARSNLKYLYWTAEQMVAHHTSTGCNMRCGDLLASGTVSGPDAGSYGSMIELSWRGSKEVSLDDGSTRKFLHDGDVVVLRGAAGDIGRRVGFGECRGRVLPPAAAAAKRAQA